MLGFDRRVIDPISGPGRGKRLSDQFLINHRERPAGAQQPDTVSQLAGGVAHDFNNLLTVILGNAETLAEQLSDRQQLRLIAEMTALAARRGAELTHRLLAFAGCQTLEPAIIDVGAFIADMDERLRCALPPGIEIEIIRAGGLWRAEIDPNQLKVAVMDLAANARDAMPAGGRLSIETGNVLIGADDAARHAEVKPGAYVFIAMTDTGEGMDADTRRRAFEPFFTTRESGASSGLGLSMIHGFVKQSQGHVTIQSAPGQGTSVKLHFPCVAAEESDQSAPTA